MYTYISHGSVVAQIVFTLNLDHKKNHPPYRAVAAEHIGLWLMHHPIYECIVFFLNKCLLLPVNIQLMYALGCYIASEMTKTMYMLYMCVRHMTITVNWAGLEFYINWQIKISQGLNYFLIFIYVYYLITCTLYNEFSMKFFFSEKALRK